MKMTWMPLVILFYSMPAWADLDYSGRIAEIVLDRAKRGAAICGKHLEEIGAITQPVRLVGKEALMVPTKVFPKMDGSGFVMVGHEIGKKQVLIYQLDHYGRPKHDKPVIELPYAEIPNYDKWGFTISIDQLGGIERLSEEGNKLVISQEDPLNPCDIRVVLTGFYRVYLERTTVPNFVFREWNYGSLEKCYPKPEKGAGLMDEELAHIDPVLTKDFDLVRFGGAASIEPYPDLPPWDPTNPGDGKIPILSNRQTVEWLRLPEYPISFKGGFPYPLFRIGLPGRNDPESALKLMDDQLTVEVKYRGKFYYFDRGGVK